MAKTRAVWGIDIGNCSLKALRLRAGSEPGRVVADAFDYIEYPKILTQPGAEPAELIQEALKQFLSRNTVWGDRVAISVSGQSGLARFVKLPPVEAKKIPDIVRFEARQQIPFDLQDVVWDYQRMGGGAEEEGFVLETEIGLFAMKRDQVLRALQPFATADIPVDFVQLTPLALYNYAAFDFIENLPPPDQYNPDEPPPSTVVLSLGTDATDLVVTNGFRVWQRSIPLGGNHFTKALTKDLKLTFAKAEHLKRNATAAEDPKAVFQAMRPVFNDLLTEVQRSIGYFTSIDRAAKIDRILALGNAMKLPGLRRYLSQSLGLDVVRIDAFPRMSGSEVTAAPAFQENLLCFGVCYGLAIQGLGLGALRTNLLPREILRERLIRQKKPWAVGAAALLLAAFAFSFGSDSLSVARLDDSVFGSALSAANAASSEANKWKSEVESAKAGFNLTNSIGEHLVSNVEGRVLWLEVLKAINSCLPTDPPDKELDKPEDIALRNQLHIESIQCEWSDDLSGWYTSHPPDEFYQSPADENAPPATPGAQPVGPNATTPTATPPATATPTTGANVATSPIKPIAKPLGTPARLPGNLGTANNALAGAAGGAALGTQRPGPSGPGWVFVLKGYHYHNQLESGAVQGPFYIRDTLLAALHSKKVELPTPDGEGTEEVSLKDLGIGYPLLVGVSNPYPYTITNPFPMIEEAPDPAETGMPVRGPTRQPGPLPRGGFGGRPLPSGTASGLVTGPSADKIELNRYDFEVQFCWQPTPPTKRHEIKEGGPGGLAPPGVSPPGVTPPAATPQPSVTHVSQNPN